MPEVSYPIGVLAAMAPHPLRGKLWRTSTYGMRLRIGAAPDQDVVIGDKFASRFHSEVWLDPDKDEEGKPRFFVRDMQSTNGTYVRSPRRLDDDGNPVKEQVEDNRRIYEDDEIHIGETIFLFKIVPLPRD